MNEAKIIKTEYTAPEFVVTDFCTEDAITVSSSDNDFKYPDIWG